MIRCSGAAAEEVAAQLQPAPWLAEGPLPSSRLALAGPVVPPGTVALYLLALFCIEKTFAPFLTHRKLLLVLAF